jgi:hypothetical protein
MNVTAIQVWFETLQVPAWTPQALQFLVWAIFAVAVVIVISRWRSRNKPIQVFNSAAGHVQVSRKALHDLAHSACVQIGADNRPSIRFKARRDRLDFTIRLQLQSGQRLGDVAARLQEHLAAILHDHLGIETAPRIHVIAERFKETPRNKRSSSKIPVGKQDIAEEESAFAEQDDFRDESDQPSDEDAMRSGEDPKPRP